MPASHVARYKLPKAFVFRDEVIRAQSERQGRLPLGQADRQRDLSRPAGSPGTTQRRSPTADGSPDGPLVRRAPASRARLLELLGSQADPDVVIGAVQELADLAVGPDRIWVGPGGTSAPRRFRVARVQGGGRLATIGVAARVERDPLVADTVERCAGFVRLAFELAARHDQLRHRATHDPLTGLLNRPAFLEALQEALDDGTTLIALLSGSTSTASIMRNSRSGNSSSVDSSSNTVQRRNVS